MDSGILIDTVSRLVLGAVAAFLAIMLWSKNHDLGWMFIVVGTILNYVDIVYSALGIFGVNLLIEPKIGSRPVLAIVLSVLPELSYIAAFYIMVRRKFS
jgi:hypothetical protein